MPVLVVVEHDNAELKDATLNTVSAAKELDEEVWLLVAGAGCGAVAEAAAKVEGVSRVLLADDERYRHQLAEVMAPLIAELAGDCGWVLAPATTFGKNILPRAAALLDAQQISDIVEVVSGDTFVRPIYAGNAMATVRSSDAVKLITVRTTAWPKAAREGGQAAPQLLQAAADPGLSSFIGRELSSSERPDLAGARVVISGGRGMQSADNFRLLETIADKLGAAIGASRAAVDAGFVPNEFHVGQTGKVVAPDLYIAVGISGAIQHLAGMKDSKVIVAINKDADAPIFQIADYGLVADLFKALPELERELSN